MIVKLAIILFIYFGIGGIIMAFVNSSKDAQFRRNNWIKYFVYFLIIAVLFITILLKANYFHYLSTLILFLGLFEIIRLILSTQKIKVGIISLLIFSLLAVTFYLFSQMPSNYLFYTLFLTTVFDSFSQLTGQLLGKRHLFRNISPNKTLEGLIGGYLITLLTAIFIHDLLDITVAKSILTAVFLATFSMVGDLIASYCKRKFEVKDFGRLLPGHGGVLDRFDSLIASGSIMFLLNLIFDV